MEPEIIMPTAIDDVLPVVEAIPGVGPEALENLSNGKEQKEDE